MLNLCSVHVARPITIVEFKVALLTHWNDCAKQRVRRTRSGARRCRGHALELWHSSERRLLWRAAPVNLREGMDDVHAIGLFHDVMPDDARRVLVHAV